jgi:hypothetical protein
MYIYYIHMYIYAYTHIQHIYVHMYVIYVHEVYMLCIYNTYVCTYITYICTYIHIHKSNTFGSSPPCMDIRDVIHMYIYTCTQYEYTYVCIATRHTCSSAECVLTHPETNSVQKVHQKCTKSTPKVHQSALRHESRGFFVFLCQA